MDTVPFHFDTYAGFGEVQGLARLDEHGLELQFSTRDALFGVLKSAPRSVRVPLDALLSVRYRAGWLWLAPGIELRVRDLAVLHGVPESDQGRVTLRLAWADRRDGRSFAADLERLRSLQRVRHLDRVLDRLASTPIAGGDATPPTAPAQQPAPARQRHPTTEA